MEYSLCQQYCNRLQALQCSLGALLTSLCLHLLSLQMNLADSERMAGVLESVGYECAEDPSAADVLIYNTCSIREKAEVKVYSALGKQVRTCTAGTPSAADDSWSWWLYWWLLRVDGHAWLAAFVLGTPQAVPIAVHAQADATS